MEAGAEKGCDDERSPSGKYWWSVKAVGSPSHPQWTVAAEVSTEMPGARFLPAVAVHHDSVSPHVSLPFVFRLVLSPVPGLVWDCCS